MKLVPLEDRVVLKLKAKEEKTKSGIVLPDTAREKASEATVLAAGPGKYDSKGKLLPMPVKVGDTVLIPKHGFTEVKVDGEDYMVIRASELFGIVGKSKK
jgi:chaperonin GroES